VVTVAVYVRRENEGSALCFRMWKMFQADIRLSYLKPFSQETTAEKAVGANAHVAAVRIGVIHGFLVYMALVVDTNNNFQGVLVDPGNEKVLSSCPMSMEAMMRSGMGINMRGPGMLFLQPNQAVPAMMCPGMMCPGIMVPGMSGYGARMMQHRMMKGPGTMIGHP